MERTDSRKYGQQGPKVSKSSDRRNIRYSRCRMMWKRVLLTATSLAAVTIGFALLYPVGITPTCQSGNTVEIDMTASEWLFDPNKITVRLCDLVVFRIRNVGNVAHGFAILGFIERTTIPSGHEGIVKIVEDRVGEFVFYCDVVCGEGHARHKGTLIVVA